MIVHEEFMQRGRPMHEKPCGAQFPCLPLLSIKDAIAFHRYAVEHMHNDAFLYLMKLDISMTSMTSLAILQPLLTRLAF